MARYVVGIDLGTTNTALAYVDLKATGPKLEIKTFAIPQLVGPGRVGERSTLPSFLYLPGPYELDPEALALPWAPERDFAVGTFARDQGALVPGRLVSSAKSWLCHGGVDREAPILPWGAGEEVKKVSPVEASARYLAHLREAWNFVMAAEDPANALENQLVIVTVPASFDEVARELTRQAAEKAGLSEVILLEEPVAALYAWLSQHEDHWQEMLKEGEKVLVCDVGGGTSDFTLVEVRRGAEGLSLERIAVGDHILLGGDNIDLALARLVERKLPGTRLDFARFQTLTFLCRELKERLLAPDGPQEDAVRLPGRGTSLIADTLVVKVSKDEALALILKDFFPEIEYGPSLKRVESVPRVLPEWGLPFARDPAVTRHLAAFLYRHEIKGVDVLLFNGGALKPPLLRARIREEVAKWFAQTPPRELETVSLDLAVSIGAAYYGLVRQGLGIRVGGGLPRAYYLGVAAEGKGPQAVCLVPKGTKEGERLVLPHTFKALTNRPVKFPIYTSSLRKDPLGQVVSLNEEEFVPLPPLTTVLKFGRKAQLREIPVEIEVYLSELGILETYCRSKETPHRWRLQFALREMELKRPETPEGVLVAPEESSAPQVEEELLEAMRAALDEAFAHKEKLPLLTQRLEEILEMERDRWSLPVLRALADLLLERKKVRERTALHEARWLNLTGFSLRPGYGEALDPFRIRKLWGLYFEGLKHRQDKSARLEWWIFWRRIAGGLNKGQQEQFFAQVRPFLVPGKGKKKGKVPKIAPQERVELWLCVANLERLAPGVKIELAQALLRELKKLDRRLLLAFSRLLARELLYGPADTVIPAKQAEPIVLQFLKRLEKKEPKGALARAVLEVLLNMARLSGDRVRDLSEDVRAQIMAKMKALGAPEELLRPLQEVVPLKETERAELFGESLPLGLKLS